jgi:hypothetical protein
MEERVQPLQLQMELGLAQLQLELLMYLVAHSRDLVNLPIRIGTMLPTGVMVLFHLLVTLLLDQVLISLQ